MKAPPKISDSEWEIMRVLWEENPLTSYQIQERTKIHLQTAKTYLSRLLKKGAIGYTKAGRFYLYRPMFTEVECQKSASHNFLDRVFGGSLLPMLSHLVEENALDADEIARLRKILNEHRQ